MTRHDAVRSLTVEDLRGGYNAIEVLHGVSLTVGPGEAVALLGPNGAGKTATLRAISGLLPNASGSIRYGDVDLTRVRPHEVVAEGVAHVLQGRQVFQRQTVLDNLLVARRRTEAAGAELVDRVLDIFPALKPKLHDPCSSLSGGQQQMVAIARALMSRPTLLVLDEPTLGLAPKMLHEVYDAIGRLRDLEGVGVLLVEQQAGIALSLTSRAYVLRRGEILIEERSDSLARDDRLVDAYLH